MTMILLNTGTVSFYFDNIFIQKITYDHSVDVNQGRNDHMQLYSFIIQGK